MTDLIKISSERVRAEIHPLGAQLFSLRDQAGRDLQWNGDQTVWKGRAPILFPIIGALLDNQYRLDDCMFSLPRHGFARDRLFALVEANRGCALFRLNWDKETFTVYPFRFQLDLQFSLSGATLRIAASVRNLEDKKSLPASFGFHPAFRWPLPYGQTRESHFLKFEEEEPAPVRRLDSQGLLMPTEYETQVRQQALHLDDDLFAADAIIFDKIVSRRVSYGAQRGPRLEIAWGGMPYLGVWTKPGAGFICIEPWSGLADPQGYCGDFHAKPGITLLPPGTERQFAMSITLTA